MISIKDLSKAYANNVIFEKFSIDFEEHKISSILGVSGIGKTTLLNIIAGLAAFEDGDLTDFKDKRFSYIFQEPRLLQWKTVFENILFVLKDLYINKDAAKITNSYLDLVELTNFKNYYPNALSGGMEQRVSIARAFAYPSDILIMDEPFKSLDFKLKTVLMKAFINLWVRDKRTVLFVTHDIEEAAYIGNNIFILDENKPTKIKKILDISVNPQDRLADYNRIREIKKQIIENL